MHSKNFIMSAALLLLAASNQLFGADDSRFDGIRDTVKQHLLNDNVPSVSIAVAKDGKIIWEEAFGYANKEKKIAATPDTLYSMASISKPIAATGLMVLVKRGLVDLDKPINDYLGDAKLVAHIGDAKDATVRRVANHTSGLPLHYQFFYDDEDTKRPPMEESIRRYGHLVYQPGEMMQYSNFGFGLIDHVISRVSGKAYADFMREEVFLPLGMKHSSAARPVRFKDEQIAVRYMPNGTPVPFYTFDHPGASAAYISAHDLVRFGMFFLKNNLPDQKPVLSNAEIDDMLRPTFETTSLGGKRSIGVSWMHSEQEGRQTFGHTGGMAGVSTYLTMVPKENIAIVVLTNTGSSRVPGGLVNQIMDVLIPTQEQQAAHDLSELNGKWQGQIETYNGKVAVNLSILANNDVQIRVGKGKQQTISTGKINYDGLLTVRNVEGNIGTSDAARYPYTLSFTLKKRGDVLNGYVTASSDPMADRLGNAQSHWTELQRVH